MSQSSRITGFPAFIKRGKWVVLFVWVIVLVLAFPFVNKLSNSLNGTNNLPASDQAQKIADLQQKANPNASQFDMEVVYQNTQGLDAHDKGTITSQRKQVVDEHLKNVTSVSQVAFSPDNQAAYFTVLANIPSNNSIGWPIEKNIATKIRQIAVSSNGLTTTTTGQMAEDLDSNSANADTILLLSAAVIVVVLILLTYRSALLWIVPLVSAFMGISLADAIVYALTKHGLQMSSLDSSILIVLVFGVATDYGMLLISRYREYLYTHADKNEAVALALKGSFGAITASAATVALALLSLTFAVFSATKHLGPVAAIGVACAFLVQMTFLPAVLAIGGRVLLWPRAPKFVPNNEDKIFAGSRLWQGISKAVSRYPRRIAVGMTLLLLIGAIGLTQLTLTVNPIAILRGNPPSLRGQNILEKHFAALSEAPVIVAAGSQASIRQAEHIAQDTTGTGSISAVSELAGHPSISIGPKAAPYSKAAFLYIATLRTKYAQAGLSDVNVGGSQAAQYDYGNITQRDNEVLIPIILIVVAIVLGLLLRAIIAPILLLLTVVLSFGGSFGLSAFIFQHVLHFQGMDPVLPIFIFLFVVALGVDYNIFLMDRTRQETAIKGTREGMLHSLSVTGGVITAAGLVLAGTFAVLAQIPTVQLTEIGVAVALGVLIDSFLVRTFLVPALVLMLGAKTWWPSRLSKTK